MNEINAAICIKSKDKTVTYQDAQSIKICGNMTGKICDKGCMSCYADIPGMTLSKNIKMDGMLVDAVVINDGSTLTTLTYLHDESEIDLDKSKEKLCEFGLSKSEVNIFLKVMQGIGNKQIQKEFFISEATLKTHLNNIYKKLPSEYQQYKNRH